MDKEHLIEYCLSKSGSYLDFPFAGDDYAVIKLKNEKTQKYRIFAEVFVLYNQNMLTFSTDSELAVILRNQYPDIVIKGYHCPSVQAKYKSSVYLDKMNEEMIKKFIDCSYTIAKQKLKIQQ